MKLPLSLRDQGISQDMIATLRAITAFRQGMDPQEAAALASTADRAEGAARSRYDCGGTTGKEGAPQGAEGGEE